MVGHVKTRFLPHRLPCYLFFLKSTPSILSHVILRLNLDLALGLENGEAAAVSVVERIKLAAVTVAKVTVLVSYCK